jgi:hypothetical protein
MSTFQLDIQVKGGGGVSCTILAEMNMLINSHAYKVRPTGEIEYRGLAGQAAPAGSSVSMFCFPASAFNIKLGVSDLANVTAQGYTVTVVDGHLEFTKN